MVEQTSGAAGDGAQGSGASAGGASGAAATDTATKAGQGAGSTTASAQDTGKTTDQGTAASDTSQAKPTPFVPKLPDGMKLSDEALTEFNAIFADEKLTVAERQQKVVDLQVKQLQNQERVFQDTLRAQPAKDLEALKTDQDFGGANFQATVDGAKRIERLAFGDELGKLLKPLGMENHPAIVKGLARLARVIGEDSVGTKTGGTPAENDQDAQGRAMFPKSWDQMKQRARK